MKAETAIEDLTMLPAPDHPPDAHHTLAQAHHHKVNVSQIVALSIGVFLIVLAFVNIEHLRIPVLENLYGLFSLEVIGFVLSMIAMVAAIRQFTHTNSSYYLFIALAFFANGFMDVVHAIASLEVFGIPMVGHGLFTANMWMVGRLLFSGLILTNLFIHPQFVDRKGIPSLIAAYVGPLMVIVLAVITFALLYPIPQLVLPGAAMFFRQPLAYIPFIFIFTAFVHSLGPARERGQPGALILLTLLVAMAADLSMTNSTALHDLHFNWAYVLKVLSYLLFSMALFSHDPSTQSQNESFRFTVARQLFLAKMTLIGLIAVLALFLIRTEFIIIKDIQAYVAAGQPVSITIFLSHLVNRLTAVIKFGFFLMLVGVIGGLFYASIVIWRVTKPLESLTHTIDRISKGDLTAHADVSSDDEIGDLSKAFDRTVVSLKLAMKKLSKIKKGDS
ncbi:MAG: HAMP domain-containing protein [archaeon]